MCCKSALDRWYCAFICSQDPRVPPSQQVPLFEAPCFPSVVVEWERVWRSTEGKGSEIRSEVETAGSSESCGSAAPRVLSYTVVFSFWLEAGLGSATDG